MELNIIAPINKLSYGKVSTNIIHEFIKQGHNISLFPIGQINVERRYYRSIEKALENSKFFNKKAFSIRIWHQFDLALHVGENLHIGFPIFELDTFTDVEKHHLSSCDKLFVCSKWASNICTSQLNTPDCSVIPLGVNREVFYPKKYNRKSTIFLNIGKWEVRKGSNLLYQWFNEAFTEKDDVELWLMNYNPFFTPEQNQQLIQQVKSSKLGHNIHIIPPQDSEDQVASIMQQADCYVSLGRAEGWDLPLLESLSCGCHAIATNNTAHTEFCSEPGVNLIDTPSIIPAYGLQGLDDRWFFGQGCWHDINDDVKTQFIENMKKIHKLKQSRKLKISDAGIEIAKKFSWNNTINTIIKSIG